MICSIHKKPATSLLLLFLMVALLFSVGCGRTQTGDKEIEKDGSVVVKNPPTLDVAKKLLDSSTELSQCKEAVKLVNRWLDETPGMTAKVDKSGASPEGVKEELGLTEKELSYLQKSRYQTLDAYHLAWCYQLQKLAKMLSVEKLNPLQKAEVAFGWVNRHVVLKSDANPATATSFVLKQGFGTADQRALIFLDLLRQMGQTGCLITVSENGKERTWLAGLLDRKTKKIYLFDTRLGMAIPGPDGKGIASLSQAQSDATILKNLSVDEYKYDVTTEQAKKAKVYLVCPFSSLSPRMHFLEAKLRGDSQLSLSTQPKQEVEELTNIFDSDIHLFNDTKSDIHSDVSPVRGLVRFIPAVEGGQGNPIHIQGVIRRLFVMFDVVKGFQELQVWEELPDQARTQLLQKAKLMLAAYDMAPREQLIHGDLQGVIKPVGKIDIEIDNIQDTLATKKSDTPFKFRTEINEWRLKVTGAYAAFNKNPETGVSQVNAIWGRDEYLNSLLSANHEEVEIDRNKRTLLSYIILDAVGDPLREKNAHLLALCWLEKALEYNRDVKMFGATFMQKDLDRAKSNSMDWFNRYFRKNSLNSNDITSDLESLKELWKDYQSNPRVWEEYLLAQHRAVNMEIQRVDAYFLFGQKNLAKAHLTGITQHVEEVLRNKKLKERLETDAKDADKQRLMPPNLFRQEMEGMKNTLEPGGSLHWYAHALRLRQSLK